MNEPDVNERAQREHWLEEWRVGDVRIVRIVENQVAIPPALFFGEAVLPSGDAHPWLVPSYTTTDGRIMISVHCFVIDDGDQRIVVDTCVGNHKVRDNPYFSGLTGPFLQRLATAGYPAASIDQVMCTHLHLDHVGWNTCLVDGTWVPTFPNARYVIAAPEWQHASGDPDRAAAQVFADSVAPVFAAGLVDIVDTDHQLSGSVTLEPTIGHTPGHVAVHVDSNGEHAIITGDLIHHPVQAISPEIVTALDWDVEMATATRRRFVAAHLDQPTLILGTHFATPAGGRFVSTPAGTAFLS